MATDEAHAERTTAELRGLIRRWGLNGPEPGTSGLENLAPSGELEFSSRSN